ncbi:hypothetical protein [Streptomyces albogriseolus]
MRTTSESVALVDAPAAGRRPVGAVHFSRLIEGISDILTDLADEAEPVHA